MSDKPTNRASSPEATLPAVVDALCEGGLTWADHRGHCTRHLLPSRASLVEMVEALRSVLFPGYFDVSEPTAETRHFHVGAQLSQVLRTLQEQVKRGLCVGCNGELDAGECEARAQRITRTFLSRLPEVRRLLDLDVQAAYEGDPAATSYDEAIFCYPGVFAITNHRLAHELYRLEVPLIPRIISEYAHSTTGIDIHPGASIGEKFFIDHGTGVVIGETCVIGNRVRLYQGVTLGAKSFPVDETGKLVKGIPRHPMVEDDVVIYAGATILGRVTIGRGSTIGGNVWLTRGTPPNARVSPAQNREEHFESGSGI
ncbi:MAG: serine O-acetyltransferase EpsC [Myxococcaceae bacterium]